MVGGRGGETANGRMGDTAHGDADFTAKRLYRIAQGFYEAELVKAAPLKSIF